MSGSLRITNEQTMHECVESLRFGKVIAVHTPVGAVRGRVVRITGVGDGEGFDVWIENSTRGSPA